MHSNDHIGVVSIGRLLDSSGEGELSQVGIVYKDEHSMNAADAVHVTSVARASVSVRSLEWDYLYAQIKKSLTIPANLVMIKV